MTSSCQSSSARQWLSTRPDPSSFLFGVPAVEVRRSGPGRGQGLFITRPVPAFTAILAEPSTILLKPQDEFNELYDQFRTLSPTGQSNYLQLTAHPSDERRALVKRRLLARNNPPRDDDELQHMSHVVHIMQTNAFNVDMNDGQGKNHRALFTRLARINHSCLPNCHVCFYPPDRPGAKPRMLVHTLRPLEPGEEVTIAYFSILMLRSERQAATKVWGFECVCPACDLNNPAQEAEERKRIAIDEFYVAEKKLLPDASSKPPALITRVADTGHDLLDMCRNDPALHPAIPELCTQLAFLELLLIPPRAEKDSEKYHPVTLYERAAGWEARITGPDSPATQKKLNDLSDFMSNLGVRVKAQIKVNENGEHRMFVTPI